MNYDCWDESGAPVAHAWWPVGAVDPRGLTLVYGDKAFRYVPPRSRTEDKTWGWVCIDIRSLVWWDITPIDHLSDIEAEAWNEHRRRVSPDRVAEKD